MLFFGLVFTAAPFPVDIFLPTPLNTLSGEFVLMFFQPVYNLVVECAVRGCPSKTLSTLQVFFLFK